MKVRHGVFCVPALTARIQPTSKRLPVQARRPSLARALVSTCVALACTLIGIAPAAADDVLEGSPVVRRNTQYRAGRQEIGVLFGSTLGDPYVRNLLPGARYDLHLTDWLAVGADLLVGIPVRTAAANTIEKLVTSHNDSFAMEVSRIATVVDVHASVAPLIGKFMLLDSLPMNYDFHVNMSFGVAWTPGIESTGLGAPPPTVSIAPGVGFGGRLFVTRVLAVTLDVSHVFINRVLSVDRNNQPPGPAYVDNLMVLGGVSFFVPPELRRAD